MAPSQTFPSSSRPRGQREEPDSLAPAGENGLGDRVDKPPRTLPCPRRRQHPGSTAPTSTQCPIIPASTSIANAPGRIRITGYQRQRGRRRRRRSVFRGRGTPPGAPVWGFLFLSRGSIQTRRAPQGQRASSPPRGRIGHEDRRKASSKAGSHAGIPETSPSRFAGDMRDPSKGPLASLRSPSSRLEPGVHSLPLSFAPEGPSGPTGPGPFATLDPDPAAPETWSQTSENASMRGRRSPSRIRECLHEGTTEPFEDRRTPV